MCAKTRVCYCPISQFIGVRSKLRVRGGGGLQLTVSRVHV